MPGEALLALLQKTGFQQINLVGYTGMKTSPYTEGAIVSGEKPGVGLFQEAAGPTPEIAAATPQPSPQPEPGGS